MTYRNKKSGVTFVTPCVCAGDDWEEVKASAPAPKAMDGKTRVSAADAEASDGGGEDWEETATPAAKAPASKAKSGKKREAAAAQSADSGGEDS